MGTSYDPANDEPRKASEWLVALNEAPDNTALRARFDAWLAASSAHAADWAEMTRTFEVMGRMRPALQHQWGAFAAERNTARPSAGMPRSERGADAALRHASSGRRPHRRSYRPMALGLGTAAAAACLILLFGPDLALRLQADHVTRTAEQQTVRLDDGSTVRLGPQSAIDVAYDGVARRVRLLKGEAFFAVTHDPHRAFTVTAGNVETTDLGTEFDVRMDQGGTDVAVRQGLVQVEAARATPSVSDRLAEGDWIRIAAGGNVERSHIPAEQIAAWTQGQLVARNRPVAEVVDELRPYYDGLILLHGEALARQPLTGVYNLADPVEALRAVAKAQGATVHRISPWLLVISGS